MSPRDTVYTLYKTGRGDPSFSSIWGFDTPNQRNTWLSTCSPLVIENNTYWRMGYPVKIKIPIGLAWEYDYITIENKRDGEPLYYGFITTHTYSSAKSSLLGIEVDYVQTYYFTRGAFPFWRTSGFIARCTDPELPPIFGSINEFPVIETTCSELQYDESDYAIVVYSSIDISIAFTSENVKYRSVIIDGVFNASPPYVIRGSNQQKIVALSNLINDLNNEGLTSVIGGIYCVPDAYFSSSIASGVVYALTSENELNRRLIEVKRPTSCAGYVPHNDIILGFGYSYFTINNGQGEISKHNFESYDGNPLFECKLSVASGAPTMICYPLNYRDQSPENFRQRSIKISAPIQCGWLVDSYKIWLAQTQSSRQASMNGAQLAVQEAEAIRAQSIPNIMQGASTALINGAMDTISSIGLIEKTSNFFNNPLGAINNSKSNTQGATGAQSQATDTALRIGNNFSSGNPDRVLAGAAGLYLYRELELQEAAAKDHAVYRAQNNINALLAGYKDQSRVPATATGSNAYGDLASMSQYGFMFGTYTPTYASGELIDKCLSCTGHVVNQQHGAMKHHKVFDFYQIYSPIVTSLDRPIYVRNLLISLLGRGVYIWHCTDGVISSDIGNPWTVENPPIG